MSDRRNESPLLQGLSDRELKLLERISQAVGDAGLSIVESEGIPSERGIELAQRGSILDLASGMAACHAQEGGDAEARLARFVGMLSHAYRHMVLRDAHPEGRA